MTVLIILLGSASWFFLLTFIYEATESEDEKIERFRDRLIRRERRKDWANKEGDRNG